MAAAPKPFKPLDVKNLDARKRGALARNVQQVYDRTPEETRTLGRQWYPYAHEQAQKIGGGLVRQGAGIIAALSPSTEWETNIHQAHELTGLHDRDAARLSVAAERHATATRALEVGKKAGAPHLQHLQEEADRAKAEHMAVRQELFSGKALNKNSSGNILKAHQILQGEDPEKLLPMHVKTGNFYQNIKDPSDPKPVTIDTHAHDIAINRKMPWKTERGLSAQGRYNAFADAYRAVAKRTGETPGNVQAVTWTQWRNENSRKRGA